MARRHAVMLGATASAALVVFVLTTGGPPAPTPNPPGAFSFAALGDAPYYAWEDLQFRLVLRSMDRHDLSWVLHVGDIFWRPCSDELYLRTLGRFSALRHAVIYTPGDNEWADCWEPGSGGFEPLDRLNRLRGIFFDEPALSLGGRRFAVISQAGSESFSEFVENVRWTREGVVFATLHLVGSMNAVRPFPARGPADDLESRRRTEAATAWMRETFAVARDSGAAAVVLGFHANPGFEEPPDDPYRRAFEPFIENLEEEAYRFPGPVLAVHGDDHVYVVDHPLVRRATGRRLENFTRLQVPGSPDVGWVRVVVTPGDTVSFAFEEHVVPRWKYW